MRRFALFVLFICPLAALSAQPTPQGAEFQVNTGGEYVYPSSVAFGSDGRFVVTWASYTDPDYFVQGTPLSSRRHRDRRGISCRLDGEQYV